MGGTGHAPARASQAPDAAFWALVEAAPFGVHCYWLERDGRLVLSGANSAADRILGVDHAALVGKTLEEAFPSLAGTEVPDRYRAAVTGGAPWHAERVEYRDRRITGAYEVHAFRIAPGMMTAVFQDITERKRTELAVAAEKERLAVTLRSVEEAEARLRESEARYRAVVRSVPVVQWAIDRDGVFTLSEGLGLAALGLRPGQVVGRTVEEVYRDNPGVLADFRRALAGETFASDNHVGAEIFESHWGPVRNDAGAIVGVTGIARHVTAERKLREQVARTQKLDSLGRLAGGVAHDFNNLLTVVLSCAELLREQAEAGERADREDIAQISAAAERARDLVRQLLAFARRPAIAPEPIDLAAVLAAAAPLLRRVVGDDVEVRVEVAPALWPVRGDPGQLEQVFLNLAVNARDAMPAGGLLVIRARNVAEDGAGVPGAWVRVEIQDVGGGMSEDVKAHLFEPFFTTKPAGHGTGLGLAIVYGVVTQGGGRIQVESAPGAGTTFVLWFPRCERPPAAAAQPPRPRKAGGDETILVVDDNALVRQVTARTLRDAGYDVRAAGSGPEALAAALACTRRIDLVVTDVVMPGQSGTALADQLRARLPGIRVLFVSGYSRDAVAGRGIDHGGMAFLAKPFTASQLLERVRQVLDAPVPPQPGEPGPGGTASGGVPGATSGSTSGDDS